MTKPTAVAFLANITAKLYSWTCPHCRKSCRSQVGVHVVEKAVRCGHCQKGVALTGIVQGPGPDGWPPPRAVAPTPQDQLLDDAAPPVRSADPVPGRATPRRARLHSGVPRRAARRAGRPRRLAAQARRDVDRRIL